MQAFFLGFIWIFLQAARPQVVFSGSVLRTLFWSIRVKDECIWGEMRTYYSETLARAANSPTMPRRNASTQATNTTPWITVTHSPNWAR